MDTGKLGILAIQIDDAAAAAKLLSLQALGQTERFEGWLEWDAAEFEVGSGSPVATGIDGEGIMLEPPLRFRSLRARSVFAFRPVSRGSHPPPSAPGSRLRPSVSFGGLPPVASSRNLNASEG